MTNLKIWQNLEIFRPSRATQWTDRDEIQQVGIDRRSTVACQILPGSVKGLVQEPPKFPESVIFAWLCVFTCNSICWWRWNLAWKSTSWAHTCGPMMKSKGAYRNPQSWKLGKIAVFGGYLGLPSTSPFLFHSPFPFFPFPALSHPTHFSLSTSFPSHFPSLPSPFSLYPSPLPYPPFPALSHPSPSLSFLLLPYTVSPFCLAVRVYACCQLCTA